MSTETPKIKRVLILTYYWPPSGGAGVQRWLKFAKYLPEFGWQPVIYTPENPEYPSIDHSLESDIPANCEVLKTPISEPYGWYKRLRGLKAEDRIQTGFLNEQKTPGITEKAARFIRGNFFIPDARKFWIRPSIRYLGKYLKDHPVDLIVSTGPPHSMHLIAHGLKKRCSIPWVADFRDPWTNIDFYEELMLTKWADRKHHSLEKRVLQGADHILVVGKTMKAEFAALVSENKISVVPNGYDPGDMESGASSAYRQDAFSIAHIGSFSPARNVPVLWKALRELADSDAEFAAKLQIKVVGKIDLQVKNALQEAGLSEFLHHQAYLPHSSVIEEQRNSALLLLVVNRSKNAKGIVTGKVFEYLASGRPVLAVGPVDGDLSEILQSVEAGEPIHYDDKEALKQRVLAEFRGQHLIADPMKVRNYTRRALCEELIAIFAAHAEV